jgi:DNA-binding CsgD family transcriptional regulator
VLACPEVELPMMSSYKSSHITDSWPMTGRSAELAEICTRLRLGRSVLLAGSAGVGKSRLAGEAFDVLTREGFPTARIGATSSSSRIPLGVFAPLLPTTAWTAESGAVNDRADLLSRCANKLVERFMPGRPVLLVDDIHLVDELSATLIHQLAHGNRVTLLATARTQEALPAHVVELWKNGLADRFDVDGLPADNIHDMVKSILGGPVDEGTLTTLSNKVDGNVLFLRELVIGAHDRGVLREESGVWRLHGGIETTDRLIELVVNRIGVSTPDEQTLLAYLAFGEPLSVTEIETLGMLDSASELERKGLTATEFGGPEPRIRTAHPLYSEALRDSLPPLRVRDLVRRLADTIETTGEQSDQRLMRIAEWRLLGGGGDATQMLAAAHAARWHYDFALADRIAIAVLHRGPSFDARLLRAELASLQGNVELSNDILSELGLSASTVEETFRVAVARLDHRAIYAGTVDEGLEIADAAEAAVAGTAFVHDISARRAALILGRDGPAGAVDATDSLLKEATGPALVWACMPAAYSLARSGRIADSLAAAEQGHRVQMGLREPMDWYPCMHRFYAAEAHAHAGQFTRAAEISLTEYRTAVDNQAIEAQALFCWQRAKFVIEQGNPHRAVRLLSTAISIYRQLGRPQFVHFCYHYLAVAQAMAGKPDDGLRTLDEAAGLGIPDTLFMGVDPLHSSGWVHALSGNLRRAHSEFERAVSVGKDIGDRVGALASVHSLARTGAANRARELAASVSHGVEGELLPARLAHISAVQRGDAEKLTEVSEVFERMGATLIGAEAAADAAMIWHKRNDDRQSAACRRRAALLADKCENPTTLALGHSDWRYNLTHAESKTALLAAAGHPNREIASELSISVRTVENRLQAVYGKLGVHGRHELADAMVDHNTLR